MEVRGAELYLHLHPGQQKAWDSARRYVVIRAGTQSGKTSFGPHWLYREIQERGPGDYLVVAPTFPLLDLKALPAFLVLFDHLLRLGRYVSAPSRKFVFSEDGEKRTHGRYDPLNPTRVIFGYAADPDSIESATAKAAWLDEAGQRKFRLGAWEAVHRRLLLHRGRVLLTTTPYFAGSWIDTELLRKHADQTELVRFDSIANPVFPLEEYEAAREKLPAWKFKMFFRGMPERPPGLIYDCFDRAIHVVPRCKLHDAWSRHLGLDFGGVNLAGLFAAAEPVSGGNRFWIYRTYKAGSRSSAEHVAALLKGEASVPMTWGGSPGEDQWRLEFQMAGLPVQQPAVSNVEVGIDRVYSLYQGSQVLVFDDLDDFLDEKESYSRVVDEAGNATDRIEDKESYHLMDAERYLFSSVPLGGGVGTLIVQRRDPLEEMDEEAAHVR